MNTATVTQIESVENILETLENAGVELDLDNILVREFERGLSSDINYCV